MTPFFRPLIVALFFLATMTVHAATTMQTGLDVLEARGFDSLAGKRVALVVNHTARDAAGKHLIDLLLDGKKATLVRIFTPEHGLTGLADEAVADDTYRDIPVTSLYGKEKKPKPELLADSDLIIFDMQDVGARYYTYPATLAYTLESAKAAGKKVIVLDRPNPTGGDIVAGFVPPAELTGKFTSLYAIPTRHGMTIGELARLFNDHFGIGAALEVVSMIGWERTMLWQDTGLPWVPPSPNLRNPDAALIYAGMGWIETTNLSVGRGTEAPFFTYGAPFIDGAKLAAALKKQLPAGVTATPITFTPTDKIHRHFGKECGGIRLTIADIKKLDTFRLGLIVLKTLFAIAPEFDPTTDFALSMGKAGIDRRLKKGEAVKKILAEANADCEKFKEIRKKYLLY
ncbi:MAG TPA: DUF1343 domain-containing protein [bacterium]|nr:DUF1343 domain-containing protein [bacterium]